MFNIFAWWNENNRKGEIGGFPWLLKPERKNKIERKFCRFHILTIFFSSVFQNKVLGYSIFCLLLSFYILQRMMVFLV